MKRPCPICGAQSSRVLFSPQFEPLSDVHLLDGYDVSVCEVCGAGFADGIPEQAVFDAYYRDLSKYEYGHRAGQGSAADDARFHHAAANIAELVPDRSARILEIGCSTGHLLYVLKGLGYQNLVGVDPSPGCARAARELYDVAVDTHSIFDIPAPGQAFDLVILGGVMEHLRTLQPAVEKIGQLLAPQGTVYISVPDAARFGIQKDAPFQEFSLEHLNYFSLASLTTLMELNGFTFVWEGQVSLEHSGATWCSSLHALYQKTGQAAGAVAFDPQAEQGLTAYIQKSRVQEERVFGIIRRVAAGGAPIFVWGTGAHTQRLLRVSELPDVEIIAFVDSNSKYQGQRLRGIPVWHPDRLQGTTEPVLISSYAAQKDIEDTIRVRLGLKNEVIRLYELDNGRIAS